MKMIFPDCIGIKSNVKIIVCVGIKGLMKYHKNHLKDKILLILYQIMRDNVNKLLYNLKYGGAYG